MYVFHVKKVIGKKKNDFVNLISFVFQANQEEMTKNTFTN